MYPRWISSYLQYLWWCFKTKETTQQRASTYLNILPWLNLIHFHQLISFVEDRNAAIITFSLFKRSSQPTESLVAIYHVGSRLQFYRVESLEILSGYRLTLLVDSQLFSSFDRLSGRGTAPDLKVFSLYRYSSIPLLRWKSICMMKKRFGMVLLFPCQYKR